MYRVGDMINLCLDITKKEAIVLTDNVLKVLTLVVIVHLLSYAIDGDENLFSEKMIRRFLYVVIAMVIYTLIIRPVFIPREIEEKVEKKNKKKW